MKLMMVLTLLAALQAAFAQETSQQRIMREAMKPSSLQENLRVLTDEVGGRVPGTPAMERAVTWARERFRAAGADSVHVEKFTIPHSWKEGATRVSVVAPARYSVRAVSLGWGAATKGAITANVVDVGDGTEAAFAKAERLDGAVLLVHSNTMSSWNDLFEEYVRAPRIIEAALKGHAAGIAFISSRQRDLLYRHTNAQWGNIDKLPMVIVAREDGERIARTIAAGKPVKIEMSVPNMIGGPIQAANVVAELRGSEHPEEFVVVGAHLDSWELGTGALDNGCNAALVIDALRAIKASGLMPRRSIRFVLFSGEEEGLLGSQAYVIKHKAELDKAVAALIFDEGSGKMTGFSLSGRTDLIGPMKQHVAAYAPWGAGQLTTDAVWGSDHNDFMLQGIPAFIANQEEANYLENYHASSDTYDKVDFEELKKHVAVAASLSFAIADDPQRLGPRWTRSQIDQSLKENHLDDQMKLFGIWDAWASGKRGRRD